MRIGIDFGGTKIEAAALDASGAFAARIREPNPGTYDAALNLVADLIARVEAEIGSAQSVGLAIPGSPSPRTGLIRNANGVANLSADLIEALPVGELLSAGSRDFR